MRRLFLLILMSAGLTAVAACNTVEGVGEDMQAAGDAVEETAQDASN
jgi:predicted small secreted protein